MTPRELSYAEIAEENVALHAEVARLRRGEAGDEIDWKTLTTYRRANEPPTTTPNAFFRDGDDGPIAAVCERWTLYSSVAVILRPAGGIHTVERAP